MTAGYGYPNLDDDILDKRTVAQLPDHLWRRRMEVFLLAACHETGDGTLPPLAHMAWVLHCGEDDLEADLDALSRAECPEVERRGGGWFVTGLAGRSGARSGRDRTRAWRERSRSAASAARAAAGRGEGEQAGRDEARPPRPQPRSFPGRRPRCAPAPAPRRVTRRSLLAAPGVMGR